MTSAPADSADWCSDTRGLIPYLVTNCPGGSAGTFDVVARVKDDSGEIKPIEFAESWQREDTEDSPFAGEYPIGENVELVNVRIRNLKCTCAEAPAAAPPAETAAPN